jgi:hypothetical protein
MGRSPKDGERESVGVRVKEPVLSPQLSMPAAEA